MRCAWPARVCVEGEWTKLDEEADRGACKPVKGQGPPPPVFGGQHACLGDVIGCANGNGSQASTEGVGGSAQCWRGVPRPVGSPRRSPAHPWPIRSRAMVYADDPAGARGSVMSAGPRRRLLVCQGPSPSPSSVIFSAARACRGTVSSGTGVRGHLRVRACLPPTHWPSCDGARGQVRRAEVHMYRLSVYMDGGSHRSPSLAVLAWEQRMCRLGTSRRVS